MKYTLVGILTFLIITCFCVVGKGISLYNTEIALRNTITAKQTENKTQFDNMWKKIKQAADVSDKYKDGLQEVLSAYVQGRKKESDQLLMDWTKEAIPTFDSSIYKQLNNIVVSSRDDFTMNQKELIDMNREHDTLIDTFPNNIYFKIMHIGKINIQIITSTKTEETFNTGKEDDISLNNK